MPDASATDAEGEGLEDPSSPGSDPDGVTDDGTDDSDDGGTGVDGEGEGDSPAVSAQVLDGERRIVLTASGGVAASASSISFDVWHKGEARVRHGAVKLDDGTWTSTVFVASPTFDVPGLPYNCNGAVRRLFNPSTGQHLYTSDAGEADSLSPTGAGCCPRATRP